MPSLIVRKQSGVVLFDSKYIVHGLVKSGYLQTDEVWQRKIIRASNVDPNLGSSWVDGGLPGDPMYSITVNNCISPICFIVGKGCLQGTTRSGNTMKFIYSGGDTNTKAYVFDMMQDNLPGTAFLKLRNETGVVTFNSLQVPLNIAYAIQPPGPSAVDRFGRPQSPYDGANWQIIRQQSFSGVPILHSVLDIALTPGIEYAAFLNYSRTCTGYWASTGANVQIVGMSEGAYGRVGGISFMFGAAGATTTAGPSDVSYSIPASVNNVPTDRYPLALVIPTGNLPFPFG